MTNDTRGQVESILSELGKKIDQLIVETKGAKEEVRRDVEEKIRELKKKKEKLERDFESYKDKNEDKWMEVRHHLVGAIAEVKKAIEAAFKKKEHGSDQV